MVILNIICNSKIQAEEVSNYLLKNNFVLEGIIMPVEKFGPNGSSNSWLITTKCKALLFNKINNYLREIYLVDMPLIYSNAIVNSDWEQSDKLIKNTAKV